MVGRVIGEEVGRERDQFFIANDVGTGELQKS